MEKPLSGMPFDELAGALSQHPRFRAGQVFGWIAAGVSSFDGMTNLPASMRRELAAEFLPRPRTEVTRFPAADGTVKLVIRFADGAQVEAVLLADSSADGEPRRTACISTQVGCPARCVFCKTGTLGLIRDLTSAEIVEQMLLLKAEAEEAGRARCAETARGHAVSNIVVMGMGEPLLNLASLRGALSVIGDARGLGFSSRRVTVSTCGIVAGIKSLADDGPAVRLALSLTAADESLRRRLMPVTAAHPLGEVKEALRHFQRSGGGRVTLEAVLLDGINDRDRDAAAIAAFAEGLDATVNLIPWNPVKGLEFEGTALREPSPRTVAAFAESLKARGLGVTRRFRRGRRVMGACGQLGGDPVEKQS